MSKQSIKLDIVCQSCAGTGLYVGLAERDGSAVVCYQCKGTGKYAYQFEYEPFAARRPAPKSVTRVHVSRGYVLSEKHPDCGGGMPITEYEPGMIVPADERLYCPFLYTGQAWCAKPESPPWRAGEKPGPRDTPLSAGQGIDACKHWDNKADCWALFHASAPKTAKRQVS